MAIEPGQIIGDYEVLGQLGAGGMGTVYKVRNVISERIDAMKVLRLHAGSSPDAESRFLREIKLQASLKHPNIAVLYTAMHFEEQILMFMEMIEGVGLDQRLRRGSLPPEEAVRYASQCLMALEYAHERGVVHRDIKPSNLMITPAGAKLLDFGIARGTQDLTLTGAGIAVGSAHYMSPEQALGQDVDARSDLYSMGVVLYEMLIGARPFSGENVYSVLRAHLEQEPLSPVDLNPALPPVMCDAVLKAMRKKREERFQTAAAFRAAIQGAAFADTQTIHRAHRAPSKHSAGSEPAATIDSATATRLAALLADEVGPIARHLVKQASAQTNDLREVCRRVAEQVSDETGRRRFLEKCERELRVSSPAQSPPPVKATAEQRAATGSATAWDAPTLERARKALAEHVGPVAKFIVDKAAKKCSTLDQLYTQLADEIENPAGRAKFIAGRPRS